MRKTMPTNGVSVSIKTADGKQHDLPVESFNIQSNSSGGETSTGCQASLKHHISTKDPKTSSLMGVSIEVGAWMSDTCSYEDVDSTYNRCEQFVENKIKQTQSRYVKSFNLEDWFST